ncbi:MAG: CinA family protein [Leucobacter sp.]
MSAAVPAAEEHCESFALAAEVIRLAGDLGLRIATAESLTGGLVADALVSVPGTSLVFSGGIVAYDTALKHSLLGVDGELLRERGPVDAEVARQMAAGVRRACAVPGTSARPVGGVPAAPCAGEFEPAPGKAPESEDAGELVAAAIGIATTGVAGPDPDPQTGQSAGTVWIAVSSGEESRARRLALSGDRVAIRVATVNAALEMLLEELAGFVSE